MFCIKCGSQNLDCAKFCQSCGSEIKASDTFISPPSYGTQPHSAPMPAYVAKPGKGLGIASMVLGIISLPFNLIFAFIVFMAIPVPVTSIVLGSISLYKSKQAGIKNGMAISGIVCSIIALALPILWIIISIVACNGYNML